MAIKKFLRRRKRAKGEGRTTPFFQGESVIHDEGHSHPFFSSEVPLQTKMKMSKPGDPQEQEADKMADKVVHKKNEEEKMHKKAGGKKEEIKKKEKEEPLSAKGKEEPIAKKEASDTHDRDQLEDHSIATKMSSSTASPAKSLTKSAQSDGATSLPTNVNREMSTSFGYDFSKVNIYRGAAAAEANERIGSQAFTYRGDVYFNNNKFSPDSQAGKWLLAHELTHVVQQNSDSLTPVMKKDVPGISMPVPDKFKLKKKEETIIAAEGTIVGTKVRILPDAIGEVKEGTGAGTNLKLAYHIDAPIITAGKITRAGGKAVITLIIQTTYKEGVDPAMPSKYGRGTTDADKKGGTTSLRFHEGAHGERALVYLREHPLPTFEGKTGDTVKAYEAAVADFEKRLENYKAKMIKDNFQEGDCSGSPEPDCSK